MSLALMVTCTQCHLRKDVSYDPGSMAPSVCNDCVTKDLTQIRKDYLESLSEKFTNEDRLARIEALLYDYSMLKPGD